MPDERSDDEVYAFLANFFAEKEDAPKRQPDCGPKAVEFSDDALAGALEVLERKGRHKDATALPQIGDDCAPSWRTARGERLDGHVTRAEGRKVYALHRTECGRCGGMGGNRGWPGYTCFDCNGKRKVVKEVRLYSAAQMSSLERAKEAAKRRTFDRVEERRRQGEAERKERAEKAVAVFKEKHGPLYESIKLRGLDASDPDVSRLLWKMEARGDDLYDDEIDRLRERLDRAMRREQWLKESRWIANLDDRIELRLTCQRVQPYNASVSIGGRLRPVLLRFYTFTDRAGNVVEIKTSDKDLDIADGDVVTLKGTVKDHKEREGVPTTVLNRPAIIMVQRKADMGAAVEASKSAFANQAAEPTDEDGEAVAPRP